MAKAHRRAVVLEAKGQIHFIQAQLTAWQRLSYLLCIFSFSASKEDGILLSECFATFKKYYFFFLP